MKHLTAIMLTLAMLCAVSCNGNTNTPAETTATTVGSDAPIAPPETTETTATVTEGETAETTTAPTPSLPKFDINSEECLMYRLLDMTYEEIEAEFEYGDTLGGISESGNQSLYFKSGDTEYGLMFYYEDYHMEGSDSFEISKDTKPRVVSVWGSAAQVYPGINSLMNASEVSNVIDEWDYVCLLSSSTVLTLSIIDEYLLTVGWEITDENLIKKIKEETDGENREEQKLIRKKYADEFVGNLKNQSARVHNVEVRKDFEDDLEAIKNS